MKTPNLLQLRENGLLCISCFTKNADFHLTSGKWATDAEYTGISFCVECLVKILPETLGYQIRTGAGHVSASVNILRNGDPR